MIEDLKAKYVVVDPKIDDMLDILQSKAMRNEPLGNVQEEIAAVAAEIERLRLIAKPKVEPEDQFRINFMAASGLNSVAQKDRISGFAKEANTTVKVINDILTGAQTDLPLRLVARLAHAIGTQPHVLLRGVA